MLSCCHADGRLDGKYHAAVTIGAPATAIQRDYVVGSESSRGFVKWHLRETNWLFTAKEQSPIPYQGLASPLRGP